MIEIDEVEVAILPDKMIYNGELYDVEPADEESKNDLFVRKIKIYKNNGMLEKIILDCDFHPNCNPDTKELCINSCLIGEEVNNNLLSIICSSISVYNLDKAYQRPWGKIIYEKCKTMKIKVED